MAFSLVASTLKQSSNNSSVTSDAIDTTGATFLAVLVAKNGDTAPSFSDSKGNNSWSSLTQYGAAGSNTKVQFFYCLSPTVGPGHTFTASVAANACPSLIATSWSGGSTTYTGQQSGASSGSAQTTLATGSITPPVNDCLVLSGAVKGAAGASGTFSVSGGSLVELHEAAPVTSTAVGIALAYVIQTTAGAVDATWTLTTSDTWGNAVTVNAFQLGGGAVGFNALLIAP